jgi:hypothetical protein
LATGWPIEHVRFIKIMLLDFKDLMSVVLISNFNSSLLRRKSAVIANNSLSSAYSPAMILSNIIFINIIEPMDFQRSLFTVSEFNSPTGFGRSPLLPNLGSNTGQMRR